MSIHKIILKTNISVVLIIILMSFANVLITYRGSMNIHQKLRDIREIIYPGSVWFINVKDQTSVNISVEIAPANEKPYLVGLYVSYIFSGYTSDADKLSIYVNFTVIKGDGNIISKYIEISGYFLTEYHYAMYIIDESPSSSWTILITSQKLQDSYGSTSAKVDYIGILYNPAAITWGDSLGWGMGVPQSLDYTGQRERVDIFWIERVPSNSPIIGYDLCLVLINTNENSLRLYEDILYPYNNILWFADQEWLYFYSNWGVVIDSNYNPPEKKTYSIFGFFDPQIEIHLSDFLFLIPYKAFPNYALHTMSPGWYSIYGNFVENAYAVYFPVDKTKKYVYVFDPMDPSIYYNLMIMNFTPVYLSKVNPISVFTNVKGHAGILYDLPSDYVMFVIYHLNLSLELRKEFTFYFAELNEIAAETKILLNTSSTNQDLGEYWAYAYQVKKNLIAIIKNTLSKSIYVLQIRNSSIILKKSLEPGDLLRLPLHEDDIIMIRGFTAGQIPLEFLETPLTLKNYTNKIDITFQDYVDVSMVFENRDVKDYKVEFQISTPDNVELLNSSLLTVNVPGNTTITCKLEFRVKYLECTSIKIQVNCENYTWDLSVDLVYDYREICFSQDTLNVSLQQGYKKAVEITIKNPFNKNCSIYLNVSSFGIPLNVVYPKQVMLMPGLNTISIVISSDTAGNSTIYVKIYADENKKLKIDEMEINVYIIGQNVSGGVPSNETTPVPYFSKRDTSLIFNIFLLIIALAILIHVAKKRS